MYITCAKIKENVRIESPFKSMIRPPATQDSRDPVETFTIVSWSLGPDCVTKWPEIRTLLLATNSNARRHVKRSIQMEVLTDENISPAFKRIKYGIRGWLEDRTYEIKQELARVSIIYSQRPFQRLMVGSKLEVAS